MGSGTAMADQVVVEITDAGGQGVANYDSVATVEGGEGILKTALDAFGKVDIVVNNAGILRDKTLANIDEPAWDTVVAVHLKGTYCVTRPVYAHMKERGEGGVIVNTSSTSGLLGTSASRTTARPRRASRGSRAAWRSRARSTTSGSGVWFRWR